jgi:protein required for attachment to host cells
MEDNMKQYILVANAARARVFAVSDGAKAWALEKEFDHPSSRAKRSDLLTDAAGRVRQSFGHGSRPAMAPDTDPKEVEALDFAHELAEHLESGLSHNRFDRVTLVAPPHFLGLLRQTVSEQVRKRINAAFDKDYTTLPARDLPEHIPLDER